MEKGRHKDKKTLEMPFQVDHKLNVDISTQVTDDYLARGALTALLATRIHTGRDVLVITVANKGNLPVHPDPIDLILRDPARDADTIADALIAYLDTGAAPGTIALGNTFVAGAYEY